MNETGINKFDISLISKYRTEVYGIVILWIMLFHGYLVDVAYFENIPALSYVGKFITYGNMGVECFLFLSGIGLYFSFQKDSNLFRFLKRRFQKVYPPILVIGGTYWILMAFFGKRSVSATCLSLTGIRFWFDGNQEIWFCSLILLCYLLYPYIYAFIFRAPEDGGWKIFFRTIFLMLIVMLVTWSAYKTGSAKDSYERLEIALTRLPVFIFGCGFGRIVYQKKLISNIWWVVISISAMLCFLILESGELHGPLRRWYMMAGGVPLVFLFSAVMKKTPEILRKVFRFLGNMSLELYITHLALKRLYERSLLPITYQEGSTARWLLIIAAAVGLSYAAWNIEGWAGKRFLFMKEKWSAGE